MTNACQLYLYSIRGTILSAKKLLTDIWNGNAKLSRELTNQTQNGTHDTNSNFFLSKGLLIHANFNGQLTKKEIGRL